MPKPDLDADLQSLRDVCLKQGTAMMRGCHLVGLPLSGNGVSASVARRRRAFVRSPLPDKINRKSLQAADVPGTSLILRADELTVASRDVAVVTLEGLEREFAVLLVSNESLSAVHGQSDQQRTQFATFTEFCGQAELIFASRRDELSAIGRQAAHWIGWLFAVACDDAALSRSEGNGIRSVSKLWLASLKAIDRLLDSLPQKKPLQEVKATDEGVSQLDRICEVLTKDQAKILRFLWTRKHATRFSTLLAACWNGKKLRNEEEAVFQACKRLNKRVPEFLMIHRTLMGDEPALLLEVFGRK